MLVVGVAEPENPQPGPDEQASKGRHFTYEEAIGTRLVWATKRCVEAVGVFGLTGTRQRILVSFLERLLTPNVSNMEATRSINVMQLHPYGRHTSQHGQT